jgi:hypothetical protein
MAWVIPCSLVAQDSGAAMLHTNGDVLLDNSPAATSTALLKDETVQTKKAAAAKIDLTGSTVDMLPETLIQFEVDEIFLEHGGLQVLTSKGLRVRVGCVAVIPVNPEEWTQYDVSDVNGRVTVASRRNDVRVESHGGIHRNQENQRNSDIVHAGEQTTRDEKCGAGIASAPQAIKAILDTLPAKVAGLAVVGGVTCWVLCRPPEPISKSQPN